MAPCARSLYTRLRVPRVHDPYPAAGAGGAAACCGYWAHWLRPWPLGWSQLQLVAQAQGPTPSPALLPTATAEPPKPDQRFVIVGSGNFHTCALRANGEAVCWGASPPGKAAEHGQADFGQASPPNGERFAANSSGGFHTCGLRDDGAAACWGPASTTRPRTRARLASARQQRRMVKSSPPSAA